MPFYNLVLPLFFGFEKDHPSPTPRMESGRKHHMSDEEEESAWTQQQQQQQQRGLLASPKSNTFSGTSSGSFRERDRERDGSRERDGWNKESKDGTASPRGSMEADSWEATSRGSRARPDVVDIKLHHDAHNVSFSVQRHKGRGRGREGKASPRGIVEVDSWGSRHSHDKCRLACLPAIPFAKRCPPEA